MGYTRNKIVQKGFDEKKDSKYFHRNQNIEKTLYGESEHQQGVIDIK